MRSFAFANSESLSSAGGDPAAAAGMLCFLNLPGHAGGAAAAASNREPTVGGTPPGPLAGPAPGPGANSKVKHFNFEFVILHTSSQNTPRMQQDNGLQSFFQLIASTQTSS